MYANPINITFFFLRLIIVFSLKYMDINYTDLVVDVVKDIPAWPGRHLLDGGEDRRYFGLKTLLRGVVEFECRNEREYDMWTQGVAKLLAMAAERIRFWDCPVPLPLWPVRKTTHKNKNQKKNCGFVIVKGKCEVVFVKLWIISFFFSCSFYWFLRVHVKGINGEIGIFRLNWDLGLGLVKKKICQKEEILDFGVGWV